MKQQQYVFKQQQSSGLRLPCDRQRRQSVTWREAQMCEAARDIVAVFRLVLQLKLWP